MIINFSFLTLKFILDIFNNMCNKIIQAHMPAHIVIKQGSNHRNESSKSSPYKNTLSQS